jgi:predicted CopG family antitoxin
MKTIAVDEETWKSIKELKEKLDARSYDEVLRKLIQVWHLTALEEKVEKATVDEEEAEMALSVLKQKKKV